MLTDVHSNTLERKRALSRCTAIDWCLQDADRATCIIIFGLYIKRRPDSIQTICERAGYSESWCFKKRTAFLIELEKWMPRAENLVNTTFLRDEMAV